MTDQFFYDRQTLCGEELGTGLLAVALDSGGLVLASRAEQEIRSRVDPAHGNGLLVSVVDVRQAWRYALEKFDGELLILRHVYARSYEAIAELAGLESAHEAAEIEEVAVDSMLAYLNGER